MSSGRPVFRLLGPVLVGIGLASHGLSWWGSSQHTTPLSQSSSGSVTITHPHHPLRGQQVTLIRIRQGVDPDLIVQLADGTHTALAMSSTDYAGAPVATPPGDATPLLALEGLRQVVRLIERCRSRRVTPSATSMLPLKDDSPYDAGR
jgi:Family of unknown function (DUF5372)